MCRPVRVVIEDGHSDPDAARRIYHALMVARHPGQKAIIASGLSDTERVRSAQRLGAGAYVKKPYTLEKIGMAVRSALEKPGA